MTTSNEAPHTEEEHLDYYADGSLQSADARVPAWLKFFFIVMPIWGVIWFYLFWNGSQGTWFDRGYWGELQKAANTTVPYIDFDKPQPQENTRGEK